MNFEIAFLFVLALVWVIFAVIQDWRTKEISNWLNFSLIVFVLGFRFFYSLFSESFAFFYQGLIGLGIFIVVGHLLYYGRFFAGGDAKLMIALGVILPFTEIFYTNIKIYAVFLLVFLIVGAAYSLSASVVLCLRNFPIFRKEFSRQFNKNKRTMYLLIIFASIFLVLGFTEIMFLYLGILIFVFPYLYLYTKAVDESCMVKKVKTSRLTEGDWLYRDVKIGNKKIKASWDGLSKEEINEIRKKHKEVLVRYGVPFSPVFLFSLLILIYLWETGLWNSFW